jgi:hypothetical protein
MLFPSIFTFHPIKPCIGSSQACLPPCTLSALLRSLQPASMPFLLAWRTKAVCATDAADNKGYDGDRDEDHNEGH